MQGAKVGVSRLNFVSKLTFIDYLGSGLEISITGAIDYTGSNGHPTDPSSLHYLGENNQYEASIRDVGEVIEPYDTDKLFPFFGFGGIPKFLGIIGFGKSSHCFPINGNKNNPEI